MLRGILSIVGVILIAGSLIIILPTLILPNTTFFQLVPILAPLHERLACTEGETIEYEVSSDPERGDETHFRCVNERGVERDVDDVLMLPGQYALGTLCLGGLLLVFPFIYALRQGLRGESGGEVQSALEMGAALTRAGIDALLDPSSNADAENRAAAARETLKQQLEALEKLRAQGLITEQAYQTARAQILKSK